MSLINGLGVDYYNIYLSMFDGNHKVLGLTLVSYHGETEVDVVQLYFDHLFLFHIIQWLPKIRIYTEN